jgi:Glycosyl transferases group 1/Methyltransferase domain
MHPSILSLFASGFLSAEEVAGKTILEVGSCDVNGSVRPILEAHGPASYLGVDGSPGPRVDRVVDCGDLLATFGDTGFDIVVTTEMLEHVADWRRCMANLAAVVTEGGMLVLTTRSPGYPYHAYPDDYWRYTPKVMKGILKALGLEVLECYPDPDPQSPGVVAKARKPAGWDIPLESALLAPAVQPERVESKPLSILGYPHQADGSGYYRFYLPYKHLARGVPHRILLPEAGTKFTPNAAEVAELDVIVGQRIMGTDGILLWERWTGRVKLIYETDDNILDADTSTGLAHLHDIHIQETFKHCLRMSDMVTVSTEPLAEVMRRYNPTVRVLPNFIHGDMLYLDHPKADRVTIGWAGGMSHLLDWTEVSDPIRDVLAAHDDVDMHFVGIDYSPLLKRTCRYTPWKVDVWDYFKTIDFDIGLAPLADTPFNVCKSHIKALEYMALGIPVVASDVPAYRDLVVDGVTGFLVRTEDEWFCRLTELINDEAMRTEMGAKGREVAAGWTIQQGWKLWRDAYEEVAAWTP